MGRRVGRTIGTVKGQTLSLCGAMLLGVAVAASAAGQEERDVRPVREIPWQVKLGLRVRAVEIALPVIDRVVLVPDGATYLDEVGKWSEAGQWPVLFEEQQLAPMFIRRFKPAAIIVRESVGDLVEEVHGRERMMEETVIRSWGGQAQTERLEEVFARREHTPAGVVVTSSKDGAWTAAVALAAGRGQPIGWMRQYFKRANATLPDEEAQALRRAVDRAVSKTGYAYASLGDELDAVTLCRMCAGKVDAVLGPEALPPIPPDKAGGPYAMTDYIGRRGGGERYAVTGWIFGSEARCAYMAMCSLFLPRQRVCFMHCYPAGEPWTEYDPQPAAETLEARGFETERLSGSALTEVAWRNRLPGGLSADVIVMNTMGNVEYFGLPDGRAYSHDVPFLREPAALHLTHSWSLRAPVNRSTIGARWLERGVYAYVGSMQEPYLAAFVAPKDLARRWVGYVPLLLAARRYQPNDGIWKVNTLGDPLMLCLSPREAPRRRVRAPAGYGVRLEERARAFMRACKDGADDGGVAEAIKAVVLLGRDEVAVQLWQMAEEQGCAGEAAAAAALGPLFRERQEAGFLRAWQALAHRDEAAADMLWHLLGPRLEMITDQATLMELQGAIRRPLAFVDLGRLGPPLAAAFGSAHVRSVIERELERAEKPLDRRGLQKLLQLY